MILKLVSLVLFWRRNNIPSIVFKSAFWGVLAWLAVGIFSSFETAVVAGLAASLLASCKYALKYLKRRKAMLNRVGGDKEKYQQLKQATNKGGLGGALLGEMLNAEIEIEDDEDYEEVEVSDEQRASNKASTEKLCADLTRALLAGKYATVAQCQEANQSIEESYGSGDEVPDTNELIQEFLPQCHLAFDTEDYCNENDHASLMDMFAESTLGKWDPGETSSSFDEESEKWLLNFYEDGARKTWRFTQHADHLNAKFVDQLINYTQGRSGNIIHCTDNEDDYVELTSLPAEIHAQFYPDTVQQAA